MTKEQRAARKPLLAKIRRMKAEMEVIEARAERGWAEYRKESHRHYETRIHMLQILNKAPGTKFWMEDQNRALAERKPAANPETCISIPNGGTPPRAPRQ